MVDTGAGADNIFRQVEQIQIADMHTQAFRYFVLQIIENLNQAVPDPLIVKYLQNLDKNS